MDLVLHMQRWLQMCGFLPEAQFYLFSDMASAYFISIQVVSINTLRTGSFKLFKRPLPGF